MFQELFIPNVINEWNKLDLHIRTSTFYVLFRNTLLKFIRPAQNKALDINDSVGIKLLDLVFETLNPTCPCSIEAETITHYFLR